MSISFPTARHGAHMKWRKETCGLREHRKRKEDYCILDEEKRVGRIYPEVIHGEPK